MNAFTQSLWTLPRLLRTLSVVALLAVAPNVSAVDLNTANQEQLLSIRGIGPKTAQTIIQERNRGGRYQSLEDLSDRVKGIGPKKAAAMQAAGLRVEAAPSVSGQPNTQTQPADKPRPRRRTQ